MFLKDKKMMKIQTKRKGKLLSPRRSIIEQTRIRQSFERKLVSDLIKFFERNGQIASQQFIDGQMHLADMPSRLSQILLPHYRAVIVSMANRFVFTKEETDFERFVRRYIATYAGLKITQISETTRKIINKIILEAELEGMGVNETGRLIIERVTAFVDIDQH